MYDTNSESRDVEEQIADRDTLSTYEAKTRRLNEIAASFTSWNFYFAGRRFTKRMSTSDIAKLFTLWHFATLVGGVVLSLTWVDNNGLGIALIVGSLFGFGSFLAQFWSQAMDRERDFVRRNVNAVELDELRNTAAEVYELERELVRLGKIVGEHGWRSRRTPRHWSLGRK